MNQKGFSIVSINSVWKFGGKKVFFTWSIKSQNPEFYFFYTGKTSVKFEITDGIHISKSMYKVKFSSYTTISLWPVNAPKHDENCLEVLPTFREVFVAQEG